ncbi:MAG: hypothetical protein V1763_03100 [Parcubacteria group bacterium]
MFIFRKLITVFVPVLWLVVLELIKSYPDFWCLILSLGIVVVAIGVWFLDFRRGRAMNEWLFSKDLWNLFALPFVLMIGSASVEMIVIGDFAFQSLAIFSALALYLLTWQYDLYFNAPFRYRPYSLENLSWYLSLFCAFCIASAGFGGLILLQLNIWLVALFMAPLFFILAYSFFWLHKIPWVESRAMVIVAVILSLELLATLSFLPTGYYVDGLVMAVALYLILGLLQSDSAGTLNSRRTAAYLIVAGVVLLAVLFTAQWQ